MIDFKTNIVTALLTTGACSNMLAAAPMHEDVQTVMQTNDNAAPKLDVMHGLVVDPNGEPIIGATVNVVGGSAKTVTDIAGHFSIAGVAQGTTIEVSYIGYRQMRASLTDGATLTLQEDNQQLNEVVVVGYGKMRRKDITSSITTLQANELGRGVYTTPAEMLQGKVPGLSITNSSDPNSPNMSVILRGASTLREGDAMQPYYIVDGIPGVDLSLVAPDDIESIDVLRDATATAIYGSKAANGVIIVTTKHGREGSAHVSYNGYVAFDNVARDLKLATASQLREYAPKNNFTLPSDEGADTDWQSLVERTGISHSHNLAVNGGNAKSNYNVSLNYIDRQGVIRNTSNKTFGARAIGQATVLKDHLTLSLGVNANQTTSEGVTTEVKGMSVTDAMVYYSPLQPVRNADGSWYGSTSVTNYYNPVSMLNEDTEKTVYKRLQVTGKTDLKILPELMLSANYSYMTDQNTYSQYHSTNSQIVNSNGEAHRNTYLNNKSVFELYGNYDKTFGAHHLGAMLGYSWEETNSNDGFGLTVKNFYTDAQKWYNLTNANSIDGIDGVESGTESTLRMISFFGRINYSFDSRYNLQATLRRDGSSAFGKNNRWGTFPSVSAAWRISEEKFVKHLNVFDDLKLRVGYGVSGNSLGFDAYTAIRTYGASGWFSYTDASGETTQMHTIAALSNANPDLKWERTGMFNIGLDFGFFHNRLTGTIEYYDKRTSDLIYDYPVSTNRYPYGWMTANVGDISNKGIELTINAVPVQTNNWRWTTTLNISHNKNIVEKLSNATYSVNYIDEAEPEITANTGVYVQRLMEGCPIGQFYTYEWAGYNEDGVSQYYVHDENTGERTGETTITPQDKDRTKTGSAQPKFTFGWSNTISWRKWSLSMFFQGVVGNKIFNGLRAQYNTVSLISQGKNVLAECLTDQRYGDVNSQKPSDRYLENGSYLRLSSLSLSYDFGSIGDWVNSLSVYATCNNVFTLTGFKGVDPEVNLGGLTPGIVWRNNYYPRTRTFMVGVKVNL